MKQIIDLDTIKGNITLSAKDLKTMLSERQKLGFDNGVAFQKGPKINPHLNEKPALITVPENNKELLEKFFNPDPLKMVDVERELIAQQSFKEGYREGHDTRWKASFTNKEQPKFDPILHVDNSLYGYASVVELSGLNSAKGHLTILRNKNEWAKDVETLFVKISPIVKEK